VRRCRCGNWLCTEDNKIINVVIRESGVICCKVCKANVLTCVSGGRHRHPKDDKRAGELISKYYIEDHPKEVAEKEDY